jgi:hypothetical protein
LSKNGYCLVLLFHWNCLYFDTFLLVSIWHTAFLFYFTFLFSSYLILLRCCNIVLKVTFVFNTRFVKVLNLITYLQLVLRLPMHELYLYSPTSCHNVVLKNGVKYTFITSTIIFKILNLCTDHNQILSVHSYGFIGIQWPVFWLVSNLFQIVIGQLIFLYTLCLLNNFLHLFLYTYFFIHCLQNHAFKIILPLPNLHNTWLKLIRLYVSFCQPAQTYKYFGNVFCIQFIYVILYSVLCWHLS